MRPEGFWPDTQAVACAIRVYADDHGLKPSELEALFYLGLLAYAKANPEFHDSIVIAKNQ